MNARTLDYFRYGHCPICGQDYDTADLDQVFHHEAAPHDRLPADIPLPRPDAQPK